MPISLIELRDRIAALAIRDADATEYDTGWNAAIEKAVAAITSALQAPPEPPSAGCSALQRHILELMRERPDSQHRERVLQGQLFPTMPPGDRPRIGAALASLERAGLIRRTAGGKNRYVLI